VSTDLLKARALTHSTTWEVPEWGVFRSIYSCKTRGLGIQERDRVEGLKKTMAVHHLSLGSPSQWRTQKMSERENQSICVARGAKGPMPPQFFRKYSHFVLWEAFF